VPDLETAIRTDADRRGVGAARYEIVICGRLGAALTKSFDGLEVGPSEPDATYLRGWFADQAALQGLLNTLGELGIELSAVHRLPESDSSDA
jgi:hypothetical protein